MANPPVLLGNFKRNDIIRTFYQRCGEETLGPARVPTGGIVDYTTLEDLLDILIASDLPAFIVVSHGHPEHGLLMKFTKGSPHDATGLVIDVLADLADASQRGTLDESGNRVTNGCSGADGHQAGGRDGADHEDDPAAGKEAYGAHTGLQPRRKPGLADQLQAGLGFGVHHGTQLSQHLFRDQYDEAAQRSDRRRTGRAPSEKTEDKTQAFHLAGELRCRLVGDRRAGYRRAHAARFRLILKGTRQGELLGREAFGNLAPGARRREFAIVHPAAAMG